MQRLLFILCLFTCFGGAAQNSFQTIVPAIPVVSGESFTVQYVLEGNDKAPELLLPDFKPCRLIAGPDIHTVRKGAVTTWNYVFTLMAPAPGRYRIPGITLKQDGALLHSKDGFIQATSAATTGKSMQQDNGSDYYLAPGENAQEKIRKNLFVTVSVNKRTCYPGEPVIATFKLYSRLESKSDILKNPGFYGFTVYDMISLDDKQVTTEQVNGRLFDVHTIRKVQLYPLQEGVFTIDAMQVKNRVEFSRSEVNRKTEQEIIEGLTGGSGDEEDKPGVEVVETEISTEPVNITVQPLPQKNRPEGFSGAVGQFAVSAMISSVKLAKNEQGFLEVRISGKGNFIQLDAPEIKWPANLEGFEPVITDTLDKNGVPLEGSRTFRYAFVTGVPGNYTLPAIKLSSFDREAGIFRTAVSHELSFTVSNEEKATVVSEATGKNSIASANKKAAKVAVTIVVSVVLLILLFWIFKKKEKQAPGVTVSLPVITVDEWLQPVKESLQAGDEGFYKNLHTAVWTFLQQRFGLSGTGQGRHTVAARLREAGVQEETVDGLFSVLDVCEQGLYTNASIDAGKEELFQQAEAIMRQVDAKTA